MTSYERLMNRLQGKEVDRIPNLNILMAFAAKYAGISYSDFILKPEQKGIANVKCHEDFKIDVVTVMSDPYTEAEGFGCKIEYPEDDHPHCVRHILNDYEDVKKLKIHDPSHQKRMSATIELIEWYQKQLGSSVPIVGWVEGPIAEFADIYDINNAMMDLIAEPEWAQEVMDICVEQAIVFAKAQIKAGAHIIGMGDAAASLIGRELYAKMVLPREKKIVNAIHGAGALCKLHICGNIEPILEDIKTLQADIVDIDSMVDFAHANRVLSGISAANGNLDPVRAVMNSTPEQIICDVRKLVEQTDSTILVSGGCEIPKNTPPENLYAFYEALEAIQ